MKRLLLLIPLAACVPPSLTTGGGATSTTGPDASGNVTVPNVFAMPKDQAIAALRRAGVQGDIGDDSGLCGSVVEGRVIDVGAVCYQHPAPGAVQGARLSARLRVQSENPWHGNAGKLTEWHLMPNLVGMPVEQARAEMKRVGFERDDRVFLQWVDEPSCQPRTVCRTNPDSMSRAGINSDKIVYVGRAPNPTLPAGDATPPAGDPTAPVSDRTPAKPDRSKPATTKTEGADPEPKPEPFF
ncbi:MAG: hypothetical protein WKG01_30555 [Kofleriaceae bacterium]